MSNHNFRLVHPRCCIGGSNACETRIGADPTATAALDMMSPDLSSLPRFPLSIILSYLQQPSYRINDNLDLRASDIASRAPMLPQNRDALSFLLTTRRLAYAMLPLFRVPDHARRSYQCQTKDGTRVAVVEKYRFAVLPMQDPKTLLDRLNTRRLRGRISWTRASNVGRHLEKCQDPCTCEAVEVELGTEKNSDHLRIDNLNGPYYQHGRTAEELSFEEWTLMKIGYSYDMLADDDLKRRGRIIWPAHLELLRFLDSEEQYEDAPGSVTNKQRRTLPSPFRRYSKKQQCEDEIESGLANCKLVGGQAMFGDGISLLSSYPRSGNTLLRTLLERITSIVTGSDTRPDRSLSMKLALEHDLVGEGLVGQTNRNKSKASLNMQNIYQSNFEPHVHTVKTHFPERRGWKPVKGSRILLLVRNPYDAIDSYWNLCCTNTHTRSLDERVYTKYAKKFEGLARHEIQIWCEFHYYWIDICEEEGVPLLVVRYEDLVLDTEAEMLRVMNFMMSENDSGVEASKLTAFWKWRISHALGNPTEKLSAEKATKGSKQATQHNETNSSNTSNLGSYKPRSSSGGLLSIGKSIRKKRYSESVLCYMHEVAASLELTRKQKSNAIFPDTSVGRKQSVNMTLLQRLGYDVYTQKFPENFKQPPAIVLHGSGGRKGSVAINKTPEIRKRNDPFGRAMTPWRRGETSGDTKPFPTIPR